jgi:hypothetical protein
MADRNKFNGARSHWNKLRSDRQFSVPRHAGKIAIIVSTGTTIEKTEEERQATRAIFKAEGERLAEDFERRKMPAVIMPATADGFLAAVTDRSVSSIYTVGHGNLAHLHGNDGDELDWEMAAKATDHLKTGLFFQRQCGLPSRDTNVPMGLFVVSRPSHVIAAYNERLPTELAPEDEEKFKPLYRSDEEIGGYLSINRKFPKAPTPVPVEQVAIPYPIFPPLC